MAMTFRHVSDDSTPENDALALFTPATLIARSRIRPYSSRLVSIGIGCSPAARSTRKSTT
jgi:hypothetical protein